MSSSSLSSSDPIKILGAGFSATLRWTWWQLESTRGAYYFQMCRNVYGAAEVPEG